MWRRLSNDGMRHVLPHLIEVACHDTSVRASLDDYVQTRRRPLRAILARAVSRGELRTDLDLEVVIDVLIGPFMHRRLLTHGAIDARFVEQVLAIVTAGAVPARPDRGCGSDVRCRVAGVCRLLLPRQLQLRRAGRGRRPERLG